MKIKIEAPKMVVNSPDSLVKDLLKLRGLDDNWLVADLKDFPDYREANGFKEVKAFMDKAIMSNDIIGIVADSDADGMSSATILYSWLVARGVDKERLYVFQHQGKQHGYPPVDSLLKQMPKPKYVIVPDAGTSDQDRQREYIEENIESIVLDHHEPSVELDKLLVPTINYFAYKDPSPVENPDLSGSSVCFKTVEAIDLSNGIEVDYEDELYSKLLTFAALGTVGDVMHLGDNNTKAVINAGLNKPVEEAPDFIQAFYKADKRVQGKPLSPFAVGWYIAPFINAIIRVGTVEEKDKLFKLLVGGYREEEMILDFLDLFKLKTQQDSKKKTAIENMLVRAHLDGMLDESVTILELPKSLPATMTGLLAGELASSLQKPALVGRTRVFTDQNGEPYEVFTGSGRAPNGIGYDNFKDVCEESNLFEFAAGHQAAFGFSFRKERKDQVIEYMNETLPEPQMLLSPDIRLDDKLTKDEVSIIFEILDSLESHWGKGFEEPLLTGFFDTSKAQINYVGQKQNVLKIILSESGIELIKFRVSDAEKEKYEELFENPVIQYFGTASINEWAGQRTGQIILKELSPVVLNDF